MGSSHTKAFLLLQAHFEHAPLPITDYINDTKSVLDQAPRILNAMVDIAADEGMLGAAITTMEVSQVSRRDCTAVSICVAGGPAQLSPTYIPIVREGSSPHVRPSHVCCLSSR